MGTKNNPGRWDCYANAKPDEPMFILLGRDPSAFVLVSLWAQLRELLGEDPAKVLEARECAAAMSVYAYDLGKRDKVNAVMNEWNKMIAKMAQDNG